MYMFSLQTEDPIRQTERFGTSRHTGSNTSDLFCLMQTQIRCKQRAKIVFGA